LGKQALDFTVAVLLEHRFLALHLLHLARQHSHLVAEHPRDALVPRSRYPTPRRRTPVQANHRVLFS
jgi:hypothetical protein